MKRILLTLVVVFGLFQLSGYLNTTEWVTKPVVIGILHFLGFSAQESAGELLVGKLRIPWTRDCAGLNFLVVLWAVVLWVYRSGRPDFSFWLRMILAVPAALVANVCRVMTLLAFRHFFFPAVESPQLHYFIGFLWLLPFLPAFVPRLGRLPARYCMETFFLVSVFSLVAPFTSAPGGTLVTLSTLILAATAKFSGINDRAFRFFLFWLLAGAMIGLASVESLWLPWLLLCPFLWHNFPRFASAKILLATGTIPLIAMDSKGMWFVCSVLLIGGWFLRNELGSEPLQTNDSTSQTPEISYLQLSGMVFLLFFPFIASIVSVATHTSLRPPSGAMTRYLSANAYELRFVGQPANLTVTWYGSFGDGRHHTLPVCLSYRGVNVSQAKNNSSVMSDGKFWFREFFLQENQLIDSYGKYLLKTIMPNSSAGIHLIISAPVNAMEADEFSRQALKLAKDVYSLGPPLLNKESANTF